MADNVGSRREWRSVLFGDVGLLLLLGALRVLLQVFTNAEYGFFRDELVTLDDSHHLAWGYVAYPPLTPFLGRLSLGLFGSSLNGLRLLPVLVQGVVLLLTGLMARALGAGRWGQFLAALVVATTPASILIATVLQYVAFDYLWWVLAAYFVVRLLGSDDPRFWLGIGAALGLGALTKYTIAFCAAGIAAGALLTATRRHLRGPWPWAGAALALLIALPNLIWQARHDFISLAFLRSIHARDVRLGRADGFLLDQVRMYANPVALLLIGGGLYFLLASREGRRYRMLGWMYAAPLALFLAARGRGYYLAPAYPMLIAAGAVWLERLLAARSAGAARWARRTVVGALAVGTSAIVAVTLPTAPVHSARWRALSAINENLREEIGWPELVQTVAGIYAALPAAERPHTAILTGDGAEAGAITLYGPAFGLPRAISGFNSHWWRGYGAPPPQTVIVVGLPREQLLAAFEDCERAGRISNRYGIPNEETTDSPDVYVCRRPRQPWPALWKGFQCFG